MSLKLFEVLDGRLVKYPDLYLISDMKRLIDRDKSVDGVNSDKEFTFIYLYKSYRSPFYLLDDDSKRKEAAMEAGLGSNFIIDNDLKVAIKRYEDLQFKAMPALKMLESANKAAEKLRDYFENIDLEERELKTNKPVFSAKDLIDNLSKVGKVIAGLKELEEQVKKEEAGNAANIRGGGNVNPRER